MPIDPNCYTVYQDGRPITRGLSASEAYRHAQYCSSNLDRKCASSKQRTPHFEVRVDTQLIKSDDELYKRFQQGG